jgi:ubiquinone/menaquinone biosynthesis C-methylase UbiE
MVDEHKKNPPGAGKSSFELIDTEVLFRELRISHDMTFLDLGCGKGAYSMEVAGRMDNHGLVHAIDLWEEGISILRERTAHEKYTNVNAVVADIGRTIPIEDESVDTCLMATVLHDLVEIHADQGALKEASRVLKPDAIFAIVEYKKIDGPPGPPKNIRLSPEDVERMVTPHGFVKRSFADLSPYHYLSVFIKSVRRLK